ncbi:hypothetical protein [Myroides pelagicus]|uniref:Lipoprotein n=1 Tax=Myroides pelagicus TaxID=270914 RepID=A0A7K1GPL4_9FLAO|nr:hypothetical protein [Myroides pelagicus]MEC4115277.1 hypothetical protein [Myroides pelagicus]MTH30791.1 hypothetical protein [Myroides pelagicus]
MNKILKITLVTLLSVTFFACSNDESQITDENSNVEVSKLIENKLGYLEVKDEEQIKIIKSKSKNYSNSLYYKSLEDNSFVVINSIDNKYYLEKGIVVNDQFIIEKNFVLTDNMDDNGNGELIVKNIDENIIVSQTYDKGNFINNVISDTNSFSNKGLCQREGSETFNQCFNREADEFCDDFVSTVAYITNPQIAILIAGLCTC